jgi:hypothetical protein
MTINIMTLEGTVPVYVPGTDTPVEGHLTSCIYDGLTLKLDSSPHIQALHQLISDGQVMSLTLTLKEPDGNAV